MATFTKKDLINRLVESNDIASKASASRTVELLFDTIKAEVAAGNNVNLSGFINLKTAIQEAKPTREGRNPATGKDMLIPASLAKNVVRIKPTAPFKTLVAG